jgi:hypothetical protein
MAGIYIYQRKKSLEKEALPVASGFPARRYAGSTSRINDSHFLFEMQSMSPQECSFVHATACHFLEIVLPFLGRHIHFIQKELSHVRKKFE